MKLRRLKKLFRFKKPKKDEKKLENTEEVCVFPLPNVVLLPGIVLPLHIFEERYKMMTDYLLDSNAYLAMSLSIPSESGDDDASRTICGAGKIKLLEAFPDGRKDIFVEGNRRLKIVKYIQKKPYLKALAHPIPDIPFESKGDESNLHSKLKTLAKRWVFLSREFPDEYIQYIDFFNQPHQLADFIGYYFLSSIEDKQDLLETVERKKRVEEMIAFVQKKIKTLENQRNTELDKWNPPANKVH